MAHPESSTEWQRYPLTLPSYDPFQQNGESYDRRLRDQSKTLFSNKTMLKVFETEENGVNEQTIESTSELDGYLKESGQKQLSRMFYIHRSHSWKPLQITEEMFRKLLSHFEVFPGFLDIVFEFGIKYQSADGCMSTFRDSHITFDSWELCYGLHFVELHGREREDPWSIRQTGIYQKHNSRTWESTWCLLHPSSDFQNRMEGIYKSSQAKHREPLRSATNLHLLFASSATENWGLYYAYLEETFAKMSDKAVYSDVGQISLEASEQPDFEITFQDSQKVQYFEAKVMGVISALESNCEVLSSLQKKLEPYWNINAKCIQDTKIPDGSHISGDPLAFYLSQHEVKLRNARSLLVRVRGISDLLHRIHEFRNVEKLQGYSQEMKQIAELRRQEGGDMVELTQNMVALTKGNVNETGAMRIITFISLIYLPPTFVATFFGMGYMQIQPSTNRGDGSSTVKFVVAKEIWIYAATTIPLMLITGTIWFFYDRKIRRQAEEVGRMGSQISA